MKKALLIILIMIIFNACLTLELPDQILYDHGVVDFAIDIAQNPEKLYDLQKYYPQFYDEKYLHTSLKDTVLEGNKLKYTGSLTEWINKIVNQFSLVDEEISPFKLGINHVVIEQINNRWGTNYNFEGKELYALCLFKEDHKFGLKFRFVRSDTTKFNLFYIDIGRVPSDN